MKKIMVLLVLALAGTTISKATAYTGSCGKNLNWVLNMEDSILVITGEGDMDEYSSWSDVPWFKKLHYRFPMKRCYLPAGISKISPYSFYYCTFLDSIFVDKDNPYFCDIDGVLYTKDTTELLTHPSNREYSTYNIPSTVTTIGQGAFFHGRIKNITIPNNVITIEKDAFSEANLSSVQIGNGVITIGEDAFYGIYNLTSVLFGENVVDIEMGAFSGCHLLTSINLPMSLKTIGNAAFASCDLKTLTIPDSVTTINYGAFDQNLHMTSVIIGDGVTSIGASAFSSNSELKEITIGKSVEYIGDFAFSGYYNNLRKITCNAINPPSMGEKVFYNRDCPNIKLYVLQESIPLYSNADQWKEFNIQSQSETQEINEVSSSIDGANRSRLFLLNGQIIICGDKTYTLQGQEVR